MELDSSELLGIFRAESRDNLAGMEQSLLRLEVEPGDREALSTVFRVVHTLKGDAAALGFPALSKFAHSLEDLLDRLRQGQLEVTPAVLSLLLGSVDALRQQLPEADGRDPGVQPTHRALLLGVAALARTEAGVEEPSRAEGGFASSDAGGSEPSSEQASSDDTRTLRVGLDKLDRLMDLVGEIAIARGRLRQLVADRASGFGDLLENLGESDHLYAELQELAMQLRMVPLGPALRQYARAVRDTAAGQGKQARLVVDDNHVEVDNKVLEALRAPLTHMVRNAIDHGIEAPDVRRRGGKDPIGTVELRAAHEAGSVVIQVRDDGAGLARGPILERAVERGLVAEKTVLTDAEVYSLLFEAGFSTAREVSEMSGRGVGLDVVRRNIEGLHGSVEIDGAVGRGATVTLRLPLTLAIIQGFSVDVGGEVLVLPLDVVEECLELPPEQHLGDGVQGIMRWRDEPLPYLRLGEYFAFAARRPARQNVVVVRGAEGRAGLVVDDLYGASETVVKPLPRPFGSAAGLFGTAILGSGRVALIVDVPSLLRGVLARNTDAAVIHP